MSKRIETIRTTAFRLGDEHFGKVWVYRPGERFTRAWEALEVAWKKDPGDFKKLPYSGLATALRVMTGDFVALERRAQSGRAFIVSRKQIPPAHLKMAIATWEARVLEDLSCPLSQTVDDLQVTEVQVADLVQRRSGLCPTLAEGWVWDVGVWEVAHRLAAEAMQTDRAPIRWRLDSDAALLSWDHLLHVPNRDDAAMHKLTLHLITIPGVEDPVLSIQASLVRLAPAWKYAKGPKYAWAEVSASAPILRGRVRTIRRDDGAYRTLWDDGSADVLMGASLDPLPLLDDEPVPTGTFRTGFAKQPSSNPFGRGVGVWFHECVAHHAHNMLGRESTPVTLSLRKVPNGSVKKGNRVPLEPAYPGSKAQLRVAVVYADTVQRRRVRDALSKVLTEKAHERDQPLLADLKQQLSQIEDGDDVRIGPMAVRFVRPPAADAFLLQRKPQDEILQWAAEWLTTLTGDGVPLAAIVETDAALKDDRRTKDGLDDPKQCIRRYLASQGAATQFITSESAPDAKKRRSPATGDKFLEHAAANAVGDVFRSAGYFLRPFPEFGCGDGTLVVGIYGTRFTAKTTGATPSYVVNLVATSLGTQDAWGFIDGRGWVPLREATAHFLASDQATKKIHDARALVERAVAALYGRFGDEKAVLLFDAFGCRRFWPCLADNSNGEPGAWMKGNGRHAVVRVRTATSEVLRPAGTGEWSDKKSPVTHTDFRLMAVEGAEGHAPTCVLSGSAVMSNERSARRSTRFGMEARDLRNDWHSLGVTELHVLEPGPFEREALLRQVGILCRVAPTWDRTLRWPSPLHLARAVVLDHPHGYSDEAEEGEEAKDKPMRNDRG